jgi:Short C-terminal domain
VGPPPARYMPPPSYAPPVTFPSTSPPPPAAPPSGPSDPAEALRQLDDLRAKNLITDEEYQAKRKAILDRL